MDKERILTSRSDLYRLHYESAIEQNLRLRMIDVPHFEDFERIVKIDKLAGEWNKLIDKAPPMAIYLNKLASTGSKQSAKMNKTLIYERTALFHTSNEMEKLSNMSMYTNVGKKWIMLMKQNYFIDSMDNLKIEPRKRWNKLYDRNSPYEAVRELLSAEISNKITQLRNVEPVKEPVKHRNVGCLLRKYEIVSKILIYRRCQSKSGHEEGYFPLIWNEPGPSEVIDEVSGETLSNITLLCRDMICEFDKCTTGCTHPYFSCDKCQVNRFTELITGPKSPTMYCGSFAENCMLPIFYLKTDRNCSVKKWSDVDMMVYAGHKVGFHVNESDISATIDTEKSRPGYLRLRKFGTGHLCRWEENSPYITPNPTTRNILSNSVKLRNIRDSQHGPATSIKYDFAKKNNDIDRVLYLSCSSWPPMAESWIDRERPSNWPSKETIQTIVSKGCRIVNKPHELSEDKEIEFRFSFSEAELILFGTLTCDQRKCFVAFKALIKFCICKLEQKTRENINLSTYCLKTIFLRTCETIPVDQWHTTNGWSKCLLYMTDTLYACVKAKNIPGYFIPECNLLDNLKQFGPLLVEIESLRSHPISHAAIFY